MTREELLDILDLEDGSGFTYFENFAELMETPEHVDEGALVQVLREADAKTFAELAESYFYDISEHMPQDQIDIYNTLEAVKCNIVSMSGAIVKEPEVLPGLCSEIIRFREWYSLDEHVEVTEHGEDGRKKMSIKDALYDYRLSDLTKKDNTYDFGGVTPYELDEYYVNVGDLQ